MWLSDSHSTYIYIDGTSAIYNNKCLHPLGTEIQRDFVKIVVFFVLPSKDKAVVM